MAWVGLLSSPPRSGDIVPGRLSCGSGKRQFFQLGFRGYADKMRLGEVSFSASMMLLRIWAPSRDLETCQQKRRSNSYMPGIKFTLIS